MPATASPTRPPGPSNPLSGGLGFQRDPLGFVTRLVEEYGDISRFRMFNVPVVMVNRPGHVKRVLIDEIDRYDKDSVLFKAVRPLFGDGIVAVVDGQQWRRQRRLLQPAFHHQRIEALGAVMAANAKALLDRWETSAGSQVVDIGEEMHQLALRIVVEALFGADLDDESLGGFTGAVRTVNTELASFSRRPLPPLTVPTPGHRRMWRALRVMEATVQDVINSYRAGEHDRRDLLSMMMQAQDEESGRRMSDRQLRDEVLTMLFAGHETSAITLTWAWYLLSQHVSVADRVRDEVERVTGGGRAPAMADVSGLTFTRAVIDETLRLYPPTWIAARHAAADDEIDGYRVPAGTEVFWSPYLIHRHPDFWTDPETFDPERFLPERSAGRHRTCYIPFGAGSRICIGNVFALTEMVIVLASIVQRFRPSMATEARIDPRPLLTIDVSRPVLGRLVPHP